MNEKLTKTCEAKTAVNVPKVPAIPSNALPSICGQSRGIVQQAYSNALLHAAKLPYQRLVATKICSAFVHARPPSGSDVEVEKHEV
eukprot:1427720-Karenia_brevis.AAC.1